MIEVKIVGLNKLIKIAEQYPAVSEKHINKAINRALVRIWGAEKLEAPFGISGIMRDNWRVSAGRFEGKLEAASQYALFVHEGTAPHFPPIDAITPWAIKHGIPPFVLARSIAKKGTKANPFLKRAVDKSRDGIQEDFEKALRDIMDEVAAFSDV